MSKRVLIVEDDSNIAELLELHLKDLDCEVTIAGDGLDGYQIAIAESFDLYLLDVMLPGMDGLEICRRLRHERPNVPILMLTARSEEIDKVLGLETGADDYMTKPFSIRELQARVKGLFRRTNTMAEVDGKTILTRHEMLIDLDKRKVTMKGVRLELTPKEFELLSLLASHPGTTYSRQRLLNLVWGYEYEGYEHTVNSHINRLRVKVEADLNDPKYILTTWGVGYRFNDQM
ncbi:MAG: response regulator transcription factor [Chitinophagales bacterium]|nr:response regulator transcription factor [Chitinophagaceae bacterium]MBP9882831.1 response regulator transcription factor [Chitinophagales bacterium]